MLGCFFANVALIAAVLWRWGASEVRGHASEVIFLTCMAAVALVLLIQLFPWLGIALGDDAIERRNAAAFMALAGAIFALSTIIVGGNLGEGPSYWGNLFSDALGVVGFFALWTVLELFGGVSTSIAEERDVATGIRFAGFAFAIGLIIGRSIAGDWHSEMDTVRDFFRDAWPAALLCVAAIPLELLCRPRRAKPNPRWPSYGLLPALAYLTASGCWIVHLGRWEGMP